MFQSSQSKASLKATPSQEEERVPDWDFGQLAGLQEWLECELRDRKHPAVWTVPRCRRGSYTEATGPDCPLWSLLSRLVRKKGMKRTSGEKRGSYWSAGAILGLEGASPKSMVSFQTRCTAQLCPLQLASCNLKGHTGTAAQPQKVL